MKMVIDILDLVQKDISDSTNQIEKLQTDLVNIQKENEKEKTKTKIFNHRKRIYFVIFST